MPLDRMIPDLQASFACEDVRVEASGAHTIVGIVNFIGAPKLPIQIIKLCVWTRWSSGIGQFEQVTRIIAPDEAGAARSIAREGLTIGGWVAMWRPMEIYLYDWWPLWRRVALQRRLCHMKVDIRFPKAA